MREYISATRGVGVTDSPIFWRSVVDSARGRLFIGDLAGVETLVDRYGPLDGVYYGQGCPSVLLPRVALVAILGVRGRAAHPRWRGGKAVVPTPPPLTNTGLSVEMSPRRSGVTVTIGHPLLDRLIEVRFASS